MSFLEFRVHLRIMHDWRLQNMSWETREIPSAWTGREGLREGWKMHFLLVQGGEGWMSNYPSIRQNHLWLIKCNSSILLTETFQNLSSLCPGFITNICNHYTHFAFKSQNAPSKWNWSHIRVKSSQLSLRNCPRLSNWINALTFIRSYISCEREGLV